MTRSPRPVYAAAATRLYMIGLIGLIAIPMPARAESSRPHPTTARPASARPAIESYRLHCSGCHRADGRGVPGVAPDLREIGPLLRTAAGRAYLGRVPGVAQAPVDDEELARLLNWVLSEIAGTPPEPAYSAEELGVLRAEPLRDPVAARKLLPDPER